MPGYQVKYETVSIGGTDYLIRSLLDLQQFSDPLGEAAAAGISSATWPLFGRIWPSARILAAAMAAYPLQGRRILEIGAGLALASLVVHRRDGDVTVSDCHPLSEVFLKENLLLNRLGPISYRTGRWGEANPLLERFDLIIGSDILYERDHPAQLAAFIDRHAEAAVEVFIVDPDRGHQAGFRRAMAALGYSHTSRRVDVLLDDGEPYKGRFLSFRRGAPAAGLAP